MKYLKHFNLSENPFQKNIYFETRGNREAVERIQITVSSGGIMHLYGKYGVGKSLLLSRFISNLSGACQSVLLNFTSLTPFCLLLKLSHQLNLPNKNNTANLVTQIQDYIEKSSSNILFIIDESHNLNHKTIETIKLIINPYLTGDKVSLVLASPPEMKDVLSICPAFKQRIGMSYYLSPMDVDESKKYFLERLKKSNCPEIIFNDVVDSIIEKTDGIPRLINNFATHCLISAAASHKKIIDNQIVENVSTEISLY